jgi:hypothetical protein
MRLSLFWNSVTLLILMVDNFLFKSENLSDESKDILSYFVIISIVIGILMSIAQTYRSRVSKLTKRFFNGEEILYDREKDKMSVSFRPDSSILDSYSHEELLNPRIKIGIEWQRFEIMQTRLAAASASTASQGTELTVPQFIISKKKKKNVASAERRVVRCNAKLWPFSQDTGGISAPNECIHSTGLTFLRSSRSWNEQWRYDQSRSDSVRFRCDGRSVATAIFRVPSENYGVACNRSCV